MKKAILPFVTLVLMISLISSCTVEKRLYNKGYHVSWNKKAKSIDKNDENAIAINPITDKKERIVTIEQSESRSSDQLIDHRISDVSSSTIDHPAQIYEQEESANRREFEQDPEASIESEEVNKNFDSSQNASENRGDVETTTVKQSDGSGGSSGGGGLTVIGWVLIILGIIFLIFVSIILGIIMMLGGLAFVIGGNAVKNKS